MCTYPGITSGILRMRLQFHLTLNQLRIPSTKELEICGWNKGCHQGRWNCFEQINIVRQQHPGIIYVPLFSLCAKIVKHPHLGGFCFWGIATWLFQVATVWWHDLPSEIRMFPAASTCYLKGINRWFPLKCSRHVCEWFRLFMIIWYFLWMHFSHHSKGTCFRQAGSFKPKLLLSRSLTVGHLY